MAGRHRFQSNRADIFTFYILNAREIDAARRTSGDFEVTEDPALISSTQTVAVTPGNEHRQGDKTMKRSYARVRRRCHRQPDRPQKHSNGTLLSDTKRMKTYAEYIRIVLHVNMHQPSNTDQRKMH